MNRPFLILLGALALGTAIFAGSYLTARHATMVCCAKPPDDLSWLQSEFHLSEAEMAQIRKLHAGYRPRCAAICAEIAAKQNELDSAMAGRTNATAETQSKANELAALRARCQAQMLQHFEAVSQAMPPDQGRRYLAEMRRLTVNQHEQFEHSMSDQTGHEHQQ
jgi:hypothetical protein